MGEYQPDFMPNDVCDVWPQSSYDRLVGDEVMSSPKSAQKLRVALFSGNYNYVKDGANQALNWLVGRLLARGAEVRIYSAVAKVPAFPPTGTLIPIPSFPIPGRQEYRVAMGLPKAQRRDLEQFAPNIVHLSAPDWLGHAAKKWALRQKVPVVASVHTRFETYFDYYGLGFLRRSAEKIIRRFYRDLAEIYAPSESMADLLRDEGYSKRVKVWGRGVDHQIFKPDHQSAEWRKSLGIADDEVAIGFVGRLVMEKGLGVLADVAAALDAKAVAHRWLVVGDGPARGWIEKNLPKAVFAGFLTGEELGRAYAAFDIFFNPSITETFGNVTLEAMASAIPTVAARATGSVSLIADGKTGVLVEPGDVNGFAAALTRYLSDAGMREAHGQAAFQRSHDYDWDNINDQIIDCYLDIVKK